MKTIESKTILAKLLATENISVEHKASLATAAFDVEGRTLYLPLWADMSDSLYDLLIGHEVGHARYTPPAGWHDAIVDDINKKTFLNVLEDVRIERFIKKEYPGIVKSFYTGYRELFEKDFFGVKNIDVNTLPLIDRINLHYKVGAFLNVEFSLEEQKICARLDVANTWEQIVEIANEIYNKAKEEKELQQMEMEIPEFDDDGEGGDEEDESELEKWLESEEEYSITDKIFRENENTLIKKSDKFPRHITVPKILDWKEQIVDASQMYDEDISKSFEYVSPDFTSVTTLATTLYKEFLLKNSNILNQMAQQFEMRRKASTQIKAKISKTGELNTDKLWAYKVSEDLFKQSITLPEGKNHGMLVFMDMSGSMHNNFPGTIDQLLNLVMFCRKVNIPFDVYGFTGSGGSPDNNMRLRPALADQYKNGVMSIFNHHDVSISHIFSSTFTKAQTILASKHWLLFKKKIELSKTSSSYYTNPFRINCNSRRWTLDSTPLNNTIVYAIEIAKDFRRTHNVEIFNTIFLTDGGATDKVEYVDILKATDSSFSTSDVHRTNTESHKEYYVFKYDSISLAVDDSKSYSGSSRTANTSLLLELYKQVTGARLLNFYLMEKWTTKFVQDRITETAIIGNKNFNYDEPSRLWQKSRGTGLIQTKDTLGYDVRFLVRSDGGALNIDADELNVNSNSRSDLLSGFRKFTSDKAKKRVFLSKFIEEIA